MKKIFETEYAAKKFAEKVNGTVKMSWLPDYMTTITIWIVEWGGNDEEKRRETN